MLEYFRSAPTAGECQLPPLPMRWGATPITDEKLTYLSGMRTIATGGDVLSQTGYAIHTYTVTQSMQDDYFYNADGEMLIVPEVGGLRFSTALGIVDVVAGEIAVMPRGIRYRVELLGLACALQSYRHKQCSLGFRTMAVVNRTNQQT